MAKDDPETNPITIEPETASHVTELLSTGVPLPNKISCFVSTCVSSDDSFPSVRQEPSFGPEGVPLPATEGRGFFLPLGAEGYEYIYLETDYCGTAGVFLITNV